MPIISYVGRDEKMLGDPVYVAKATLECARGKERCSSPRGVHAIDNACRGRRRMCRCDPQQPALLCAYRCARLNRLPHARGLLEQKGARRTGHGHGLADRDLCGCTGGTPLTTTSGALPISRVPSCTRNDWSTPAMLQFSAHHAAEPSWRAISSTTLRTVIGSTSRPPSSRGRHRRKKPASVSPFMVAAGRRRSRSPWLAFSRRSGPSFLAAPTSTSWDGLAVVILSYLQDKLCAAQAKHVVPEVGRKIPAPFKRQPA